MDGLPTEILSFILWYCVPKACGRRTELEKQIWPVLTTCHRWYDILTDLTTIPIDFGLLNLRIILHVGKTRLTVEQFEKHFDASQIVSAFICSYNKKKWQRYAPFLISRLTGLPDLPANDIYDILNKIRFCKSCRTVDGLFHSYPCVTDHYIDDFIGYEIFRHIIKLIDKGSKEFQLKHVNWFYHKMIGNVLVEDDKIYRMLTNIGFSYHKIRRLYRNNAVTTICHYRLKSISIAKLLKVFDIGLRIIHRYCQIAFQRLAHKRNIDQLMEEIVFYDEETDKIMKYISNDDEHERKIIARYIIAALKRKWKN